MNVSVVAATARFVGGSPPLWLAAATLTSGATVPLPSPTDLSTLSSVLGLSTPSDDWSHSVLLSGSSERK